jgi:arginyl-tRNA synthetase
MDFAEEIKKLLAQHGIEHAQLEVPPDHKLGDYALPCFSLAKERKQAPPIIAKELANALSDSKPPFLEQIQATGPYVNLFITRSALVQASLEEPKYPSNGKTVVIDYGAPNIAKPFGIGHLRSTVIGGALKRIYAYTGWKTIGINHLGDWGTQFGKLIAAYKRWPTDLDEDPIKKLLELYVRFHDEAEKDPTLDDAGREEFRKLEAGDPENTALWQRFRDLSLKEFEKVFLRLGARFESNAGEAFYNDKMQAVVDELREKGLLEEDDGAQIVRLEDEGIETPAIILKRDGATIYTTRDLAALLYRKRTYHFDRILYEVGSEQSLHFKQLFAIVKKLGYEWSDQCEHVNHGLYMFETGKMSTRKGQVIFIEDVLAQAVERAREAMRAKNPQLLENDAVASHVLEAVGVGSIVFFDLKNDRVRDIVFDWDEILNFDGETGPYLQYTHARLRSIIRKAATAPKHDAALLQTDEDAMLASHLLSWQPMIEQVVANNKPHILARYLLDLAQLVNAYYQKHRIIQEDKALEAARLAMISTVAQRLKLGLELLGIQAPEEM